MLLGTKPVPSNNLFGRLSIAAVTHYDLLYICIRTCMDCRCYLGVGLMKFMGYLAIVHNGEAGYAFLQR